MNRSALIVEDTALHRKLYTIWLELCGFSVTTVSDERVAVVEAVRITPAIIVVDVLLPTTDGRDVIRHLRYNPVTRSIPIVAISVLSGPDDERSCLNAGADLFHQKLSGRTGFTDCIRRAEVLQRG